MRQWVGPVLCLAIACAKGTTQATAEQPPDALIDSGPQDGIGPATAIFAFHGTAGTASFRCTLDQGVEAACTSPATFAGLADGPHHFSVAALDAAGTGGVPATRSWVVDAAPPETTIDTGPGAVATGATVSFAFSSSKAQSTFHCALDGAVASACTSPFSAAAVHAGLHLFSVYAVDALGVADATPAVWLFEAADLDTALTSAPEALSNESRATFFFTASAPAATFTCKLDGGAAAACHSPATYTGLAEGAHSFSVTAHLGDASDATPAQWTWQVDTVPPATSLTSAPLAIDPSRTPSFVFTASESSTFLCGLDGAQPAACTSPFTAPRLADGMHRFTVQAVDAAGNHDPAPAIVSWRVDATAPHTTLTTALGPLSYKPFAAFTLASSEAGTFRCKLDNAAFASCTSPVALSGLAEGAHTFVAEAVDLAGNVDATPASFSWRVHTPWQVVGTLASPSGGWLWAAALGGKIYLANATNSGTPYLGKIFDTANNTFVGDLPSSDGFCACGYVSPMVAAGGQLFIFANSANAYDPGSGSWSNPAYPSPDGEWGVAELGGLLYLLGGRGSPTTLHTFNPSGSAWGTLGVAYPSTVYNPALVSVDGKLFVFGGQQTGPDVKTRSFVPGASAFTDLQDAPFSLISNYTTPRAVTVGAKIFVAGYSPITPPPNVDPVFDGFHVYDPASDSYDPLPVPPPVLHKQGDGADLAPVSTGTGLYLVGDDLYGNDLKLTVWKFLPDPGQ